MLSRTGIKHARGVAAGSREKRSRAKLRRTWLPAAVATTALAAGSGFGLGYAVAPQAQAADPTRAERTSQAVAESIDLKRRAAQRAATQTIVAGGWTGSVYTSSGIPVQAGIPGADAP